MLPGGEMSDDDDDGGGKSGKKRKKKDTPKREFKPSGYTLFCKQDFARMKEKANGVKKQQGEAMKEASANWRNLTDAQRQEWNSKAKSMNEEVLSAEEEEEDEPAAAPASSSARRNLSSDSSGDEAPPAAIKSGKQRKQ